MNRRFCFLPYSFPKYPTFFIYLMMMMMMIDTDLCRERRRWWKKSDYHLNEYIIITIMIMLMTMIPLIHSTEFSIINCWWWSLIINYFWFFSIHSFIHSFKTPICVPCLWIFRSFFFFEWNKNGKKKGKRWKIGLVRQWRWLSLVNETKISLQK